MRLFNFSPHRPRRAAPRPAVVRRSPRTGGWRPILYHLPLPALLLAGCQHGGPGAGGRSSRPVEPYVPENIVSAGPLRAEVRRVALLPVCYPPQEMEFVRRMDRVFASELGRAGRFEVVPVGRDELERWVGHRQLASVQQLPAGLLETVRGRVGADALLFVDLTHYDPYPPPSIGVRSKLVDIDDGSLLWVADEYFDASDRSVTAAAALHRGSHSALPAPAPVLSGLTLSPHRFSRYVARSLFDRLPRRGVTAALSQPVAPAPSRAAAAAKDSPAIPRFSLSSDPPVR